MDELAKSGRLKSSMTVKEQRGRKVAENMMLAELDKKVIWVTKTTCQVPSQTGQAIYYDVDLVHGTCNCQAATHRGTYYLYTKCCDLENSSTSYCSEHLFLLEQQSVLFTFSELREDVN